MSLNNCEHFCHWCVTGKPRSNQIRRIARIAGTTAGLAVVAAASMLTPTRKRG